MNLDGSPGRLGETSGGGGGGAEGCGVSCGLAEGMCTGERTGRVNPQLGYGEVSGYLVYGPTWGKIMKSAWSPERVLWTNIRLPLPKLGLMAVRIFPANCC